MTLLDFARGPGLEWSLYILFFGSLLRLVGVLLARKREDYSEPRNPDTLGDAVRTVFSHFWFKPEFRTSTLFVTLIAYAMHIGLAVVGFLFVPHILFIGKLTGLSWGGLPNDTIMLAGAITLGSLVALWVRRFQSPLMRRITTPGDHLALAITGLPVLTGMMAYGHLFHDYPTLLAIHLLSVELLFVWFPFSKLFHAVMWVPTRFKLGAYFSRRGVRA